MEFFPHSSVSLLEGLTAYLNNIKETASYLTSTSRCTVSSFYVFLKHICLPSKEKVVLQDHKTASVCVCVGGWARARAHACVRASALFKILTKMAEFCETLPEHYTIWGYYGILLISYQQYGRRTNLWEEEKLNPRPKMKSDSRFGKIWKFP